MKIEKEFPATHSMSTAWYVADEDGNVAIMNYNDNGPVPWETEETSIEELVYGHFEDYDTKDHLTVDLTDDQIDDLMERDYYLILNSQYFDEEWYRSAYGLSDDVDPADHYLKEGYLKNFNPGPDFSTFEYYECNNDVKEWKMNPLVHYEFYGINEHRKINIPYDKIQSYRSAIADSPYFDGDWYKGNYNLNDDVDPVEHYLKIGFALGYNPGPNFSTKDYYKANDDVEEYGMNPLLHYEMYGRREQRKLSFND